MAIDMSQFFQVFFEESEEHLAAMETLLLELDIGNPDPEQLNAVFRAAHSIKGSSGTFGFTDLAEMTHILENLLDRIRKQELPLRADMVDAFLETGDVLRAMLAAHQDQGQVDTVRVEAVCDRLRSLSNDPLEMQCQSPGSSVEPKVLSISSATASTDIHHFDIQFVPTAASARGDCIQHLLQGLRDLGELEVVSQPEEASNKVGLWQLRLITQAAKNNFTDQLDFIADSGAWRVAENKSGVDGVEVFGFFSDSPGVPDDERGYGFFEPRAVDSRAAQCAHEATDRHDDSFGFFEPLPIEEITSETQEGGGGGYGLFSPSAPAGEIETAVVTKATLEVPQGENGYGFFVPVSKPVVEDSLTPVPEAARVVSEPVVAPVLKPAASKAVAKSDKTPGGGDSSIRVSVEKVDQLINLIGELVITQAMLLQTTVQMQESAPENLVNGLAQLERNTRDLQESVMSIRMLPISAVFSRFPRVVRDLSGKLGKQVELKTSGETTELDKSLIERIADPLTHLIRNSLDHGIESPERRIAAGKSSHGTITLKAYHQGGNIVIEVGDDGAGLNRQKILTKGRERGLSVSDQMTDQEVFGLIFEAGFSTADQVTDVSGRGVGMDVVRKNIQALGGRVEIESMQGIGTRMTVRLPLTLAILDGMSVAVGDQIYILPLSSIVESLQPLAGDIKTLSNQARVIQVRGDYLPVVVLHEIFDLKSGWNSFTQGIMVVLDADGTKAALFVDALVGQHQVVIKSLEANYRRVPGISGATIMGDGHVALILDVSAITGLARTTMQKAA